MRVEGIFGSDGSYAITSGGGTIAPGPGPLPAPPVLFLGSLGACAVDYLKKRGLPFAGLRVTAEATHAEGPRRLDNIIVRVVLPQAIDERHMAPLRRAVDLCTLKNSLVHRPAILAEVQAPSAGAPR